MTDKKKKLSKAAREARAKNIQKFNEDVAAGRRLPGALKHGGKSQIIKHQYCDLRYKKARQLKEIIQVLEADMGGKDNLTAAQGLLLDNIRSKLIVLLQIAEYVNDTTTIINAKGELLPCLNKNYLAFAADLRRDLTALYDLAGKKPSKVPSLDDWMREQNRLKAEREARGED